MELSKNVAVVLVESELKHVTKCWTLPDVRVRRRILDWDPIQPSSSSRAGSDRHMVELFAIIRRLANRVGMC